MESQTTTKKKKKKSTKVGTYRYRTDVYSSDEWKGLIRNDTNTLKHEYYKLFDKGVNPEDIKDGILHKYNGLTEKLVLLMVKAQINSDDYKIEITDEEVKPIIDKLREGDLL